MGRPGDSGPDGPDPKRQGPAGAGPGGVAGRGGAQGKVSEDIQVLTAVQRPWVSTRNRM